MLHHQNAHEQGEGRVQPQRAQRSHTACKEGGKCGVCFTVAGKLSAACQLPVLQANTQRTVCKPKCVIQEVSKQEDKRAVYKHKSINARVCPLGRITWITGTQCEGNE